ncbi:MAG: ATPase domain-containing protein [Byssovorax sp.]
MNFHDPSGAEPRIATPLERVTTGNPQADEILGGGFPVDSINVVMGQPGTGKTIFVEQLIFHNAGEDRPVLYFTTMSEPLPKVVRYLQQFPFFDEMKIGSQVIYEDIGADLAEGGIAALVPRIQESVKSIGPKIIVIDSFKAIHDLAPSIPAMRRMLYELSGLLSAYETTTFLVGEYTEEHIATLPEFAVADGIIQFSRKELGARDERYLRVRKLRGSQYREGMHGFRITQRGLDIYPRLVSPEFPKTYTALKDRLSTGVPALDAMLGGGVWRGSSMLLAGPSGSGKTTLGLQFVLEGIRRDEPCIYANFQENPSQLASVIHGYGVDVEEAARKGLNLLYRSPVELQIDSILVEIFRLVTENNIRRVVIDAIGDLATASSDQQRLHEYLYALMQHLTVRGVTSIFVMETAGVLMGESAFEGSRLSYLSDALVLLELTAKKPITRTIRVVKARGSAHDQQPHEFQITTKGVEVA